MYAGCLTPLLLLRARVSFLLSSLPSPLKDDIAHLLAHDAVFKKSGVVMPDFSWRTHEDMFPSLMRTIVGQQLSTKAANTIWGRVVEGVGDLSPQGFSSVSDEVLRGFGLSRQKISYIRGLVSDVQSGAFRPDEIARLEDEAALSALTALKGFGEWSAQMILIFTLARRDIWPAGDLGIREGVRLYYRLDDRPDIETTRGLGDRFSGRRTAASLLLWRLKDKA